MSLYFTRQLLYLENTFTVVQHKLQQQVGSFDRHKELSVWWKCGNAIDVVDVPRMLVDTVGDHARNCGGHVGMFVAETGVLVASARSVDVHWCVSRHNKGGTWYTASMSEVLTTSMVLVAVWPSSIWLKLIDVVLRCTIGPASKLDMNMAVVSTHEMIMEIQLLRVKPRDWDKPKQLTFIALYSNPIIISIVRATVQIKIFQMFHIIIL